MKATRRRVDLFLAPGELTVQTRSVRVKTLVGSCVAVCLFDHRLRIGGVNHFLLARPGPGQTPDARYGTCAMSALLERMRHAGATPPGLEAAVLGGGHPMDSLQFNTIGDENAALALAVLAAQGIRVVRQDTGGDHGRKLLFDTGTGELLVRRLRGWSAIQQEERRW